MYKCILYHEIQGLFERLDLLGLQHTRLKKGCERSFYVVECGFGMTVRVSENIAVRVFTLTNRLCLLNGIVSR